MDGLNSGRVVADRFVLVEPLREGASAIVWRALDQTSGAEVALKFIDAAAASSMLADEHARLRAVDHPAVVRPIALAQDEPSFLALELIDGPELRADMGGDFRTWLPKLRTALDGVAALHAAGIAHGDLSLHNVVVGSDGRSRIIDLASRPQAGAEDDLHAIGVMLYKLATGLAPDESRAALAGAQIPPALNRLIGDLLDRPGEQTVQRVSTRIDAVLAGAVGAAERFERIAPQQRQRAEPVAKVSQHAAAAPSSERRWAPFAVVALAALALVTLFVAATQFGNSARGDKGASSVQKAGERLASQRDQAQALRTAVYEQWLTLEGMQVRDWASLRAEAALARLAAGERLLGELETLSALRELREADALMSALLEESPAIAAFHRDAGWQAWRSGDAQSAEQHFRTVLAIEPGDEEVRDALARTPYLDEVMTLRRSATAQQARGETAAALEQLREAARIDPGNREIADEIAQLQRNLEDQRFARSMSGLYAALKAGRFTAARESLATASRLRPDAPEVRDARTELAVAERESAIAALRSQAGAAEKSEDWEAAIGIYNELLQLDGALVFAQQGRDRARLLASLSARAQTLLDSTEFEKEEVRKQAEGVVGQIAGVQSEANALRILAQRLEQRLTLASEPVPVQLRSNNETEVTIYRVGRLGRFDTETLELLPGHYTVVGVRDGYRDVRRELLVRAGEPVAAFVIQCEERI